MKKQNMIYHKDTKTPSKAKAKTDFLFKQKLSFWFLKTRNIFILSSLYLVSWCLCGEQAFGGVR
jgi:hypothetical protein